MKLIVRSTLVLWAAALSAAFLGVTFARPNEEKDTTGRGERTVEVVRSGSQPSAKGKAEWFTGSVRIDPLFDATAPSRTSGGSVAFEPGARSVWHTHPAGQTLIVTAGTGWVQEWGGKKMEIKPGDVVSIPPGVKHWHGATATEGLTHIAIQEHVGGTVVTWMEPVTEEQYRSEQEAR